ncbi:carbohydrate ABC transporter permease [[Clostridium] polysaccharolyticum]|uniref:Multiple sugar transport system permease protein n=1 Tax=[Clostridium] polysaccharolyticum TaxID=29364 RepID=A0A1I0F3P5_9FIRM|nr:carbohydrate ABC transporter permease [[Clostridium] polysaccharolyticum]SET52432.1 multiple sugar transport system permease protein [[Clostridium] polysaccharolyticum]
MNVYVKCKKVIVAFLKYFTLCFGTFVTLIPVVVCVITASKTEKEYESTNVMTPPKNWFNFENYKFVWKQANMLLGFRNSFLVLLVVLTGSILCGTMIAYVLNRFAFPGNKLIRNLFLFATLIPGVATQVTVYQIMDTLHLIDSLVGYMILMMGTDVISIYIFIQFFENISFSIDESAIMDGAGYYTIFFRILLPLLKPAIITCMILKGVSTYNEYYMASLYLQSKNRLITVATSLFKFVGPMGSQYNYICAGVIITIIPALIIFILCQKQIYSGLTQGSVKG